MTLKGKVFISTVNACKSSSMRHIFEPLGATIFDFPMTEIIKTEILPEIHDAFSQIEKYNWIIFTSSNGVRYFHQLLSELTGMSSVPTTVKLAAVGPKTAMELKNNGRTADFTGFGGTAESLAAELIEKQFVQNCNVLLPLGNLAPDAMRSSLSGIAEVTRINVYKTVKTDVRDNKPVELIRSNGYDLILFTSPSGLANFAEILGSENLNPQLRLACIGNVTAKAAEQYGLKSTITAQTSTYEGLAHEIMNYYYKIKNLN